MEKICYGSIICRIRIPADYFVPPLEVDSKPNTPTPFVVPDINFPIDDERGDVFVSRAEMVATVCGLIGVVKFLQIGRVVGMKHSGIRILGCPHDSVLRFVGEMLGVAPG